MKNTWLTLSLLIYSIVTVAQKDTEFPNTITINENSNLNYNPLFGFIMDVTSKVNFKYREFLRKTKQDTETFQIGKQVLTKKELTKVLRKGARISENIETFEKFLISENQMYKVYLSKLDIALLYQKFRERTLDKYIDDLACNF